MKLIRSIVPLIAATLVCGCAAYSQEGPLSPDQPKGITSEQIIEKFAAKEKEFKEARDHYTFRQDVRVQTIDGDTVTGEYREVFDVTYDNQGRHLENVTYAPQDTLTEIMMSPEDLQDIRHLLPFVLTSDEIPEYDILYIGQQQEDELHCYVFDIAPKKIEAKKRYFQGRIWVDDKDLQIVKTPKTCFPSSPPGASRWTASTGFPPTPKQMTRSISARLLTRTFTSERSLSTPTTSALVRR